MDVESSGPNRRNDDNPKELSKRDADKEGRKHLIKINKMRKLED